MDTDWGSVVAMVAICLVTIGLLVLNYLADNGKLRQPLLQRAQRTVKAVSRVFGTVFLLLAVVGTVYWYVNDSGWLPRTREVVVYVHASNWITGELKICTSSSTEEKGALTYLSCGSEFDESHILTVKFWGPITTDQDKIWKCERKESSLTCKLQ